MVVLRDVLIFCVVFGLTSYDYNWHIKDDPSETSETSETIFLVFGFGI